MSIGPSIVGVNSCGILRRMRSLPRVALVTLTMFAATGTVVSVVAAPRAGASTTPIQLEFHPVAANEAFAQHRGAGYEQSVLAARHSVAAMPITQPTVNQPSLQWTAIGPQPESGGYGGMNSGRVTGLAVAPTNPQTLYLASAGGGVWSSTTNGASWATHTDSQPDIAMGAVTVDPSNASYVFAGTGENNMCLDCHFGDGVLESSNGGTSWTTSNPGGIFTGKDISSVVVLPGATSISTTTVLVGTSNSLYVSNDGGITWTAESGSGWQLGDVTSIVINTLTSPVAIYASVEGIGIELSTNSGANWTMVQSLMNGNADENAALAIVPNASTSATTLYESIGSLSDGYISMDKSTDGGTTWTALTNCTTSSTNCVPYFTSDDYGYYGLNDDTGGDQSWYDNVVAVDPQHPNIIVAAGITMIESTDGGANWTNLNGGGYFAGTSPLFHPDFHALVFDSAGNLYFGNDGGAWEMSAANVATATPSYTNLNTNLDITQFYPGIAQSGNGAEILGGTQDNGTNLYSSSGSPATTWNQVVGGDGGFSAIDPSAPLTQYAEADISLGGSGSLVGTTDGWGTSANLTTPPFATANWAAPLTVVPGTAGSTLVFGGNGVFTSANGGTTWATPTGYASSDVSAIAIAPSNTSVWYAGFNNGTLQMSTNAGATWTTLTSGALPSNLVTHISVSATDPYTVYLTYAQNSSSGITNGAGNQPEVLMGTSLNAGATWTNETGNLPTGVTTNSVISDGVTGLIVATDVGVFSAPTLSGVTTSWASLGTGLPNVQAMDLVLTANNTLIVTTHGRGAWTLPLSFTTAPGAPSIGTAVAGNASATVNWTAGSTGGRAITGYTVTADNTTLNATTTDACPTSDASTSTSCNVTGLTNGDVYTFSVAAINAIGTGAFSGASNSVMPVVVVGGGGGGGGGGPTNAPPPSGLPTSDFGVPSSATVSSTASTVVTLNSGGSSVTVSVPAGALPASTTISIYPITSTSTLTGSVPAGQSYVLSFAVSWETPDYTTPTASVPLTLTITDPSIKAGDIIYELTSTGLVAMGTAAVDGSATLTFSSDPVFVVAEATLARQVPLTLTTRNGIVGKSLTLSTRGGSGTGALSYTVTNGTARGCSISRTMLRAAQAGTCIVTATKASNSTFASAASAPTVVTMRLPARPRSLILHYSKGTSALSAFDQSSLKRLASQLLTGASVRMIGSAPGNARLAKKRVAVVERFLFRFAKIHVTFRIVTRTHAESVMVATLRQ